MSLPPPLAQCFRHWRLLCRIHLAVWTIILNIFSFNLILKITNNKFFSLFFFIYSFFASSMINTMNGHLYHIFGFQPIGWQCRTAVIIQLSTVTWIPNFVQVLYKYYIEYQDYENVVACDDVSDNMAEVLDRV